MNKFHIILTCDGGNGHRSTAEALRAKAIADGDQVKVINSPYARQTCGSFLKH